MTRELKLVLILLLNDIKKYWKLYTMGMLFIWILTSIPLYVLLWIRPSAIYWLIYAQVTINMVAWLMILCGIVYNVKVEHAKSNKSIRRTGPEFILDSSGVKERRSI